MLFVLGVLAALNAAKGAPTELGTFGWPFYELSYRHGFIRRGLVGAIFQALTAQLPPGAQEREATNAHVLVSTALLTGLALWTWHVWVWRQPEGRRLIIIGAGAFFLSQFPSALFLNAGYLDPWILGTTVAAAWAVSRGCYRTAAAIGGVGPFVHEAVIFLWTTVVALAMLRELRAAPSRRQWRSALSLATPYLATAAVLSLHSDAAVHASIAALHTSEDVKQTLRNQQYGLTFSQAVPVMIAKIRQNSENFILAIVFYVTPALVTAVCAVRSARVRHATERVLAMIAVLAPCSILLVAWDLSRFLCWAPLGAVLLLLSLGLSLEADEEPEAASHVRRWIELGAATVVVVLGAASPAVNSYYEVAYPFYNVGPAWMLRTPASWPGFAYARRFNRKLITSPYVLEAHCASIAHERAEKTAPCVWSVDATGFVDTGDIWLPTGSYELRTDVVGACEGTVAHVDLRSRGPFGNWASRTISPTENPSRWRFDVSEEDAAIRRVGVRVWVSAGCARLSSLTIATSS